ncbi:MAG: aldehyde:ferredoxin oxidoreductase [Firmicutes bacterium]|nr:aldehyde:ferredoxin oxidoreductase [Bacillota bacterium]
MTATNIKVLDINLSEEKIEIQHREDLAPLLGGIGLASKLFAEKVNPELDPLAEEQPVVLANGPLSTIFPVVTKVVSVFRSPLTGEWGESYAGMRLALAMRLAGYQAIVIHGKAKRPTYLAIGPHGVQFKNASALWGLTVGETGTILRRILPGSGHRSTIRIGPAGEKCVSFANVNVDTYRHFGRLGMGAVFGAKNLKAVVIYGDKDEPVADIKAYNKVYKDIYQRVVSTDIMEKYHGVGTAINVNALNNLGGLPTKNLQSGKFDSANEISGEAFAEHCLIRKMACSGCPVGCIHIGLRRREFGPGYEYESKSISYDHELIFAMGSYLGISSRDKVLDLIDAVEELGLDAMTAGVALGWVTEAYKNGIVDEVTLGTKVQFDDTKGYIEVLKNIVYPQNSFYTELAKGTAAVAEKYGGKEYALTLAKTEIAGYHTGHANILGQTVGARHSHLDNAGYSVDQKNKDQKDLEKMVESIIEEEKWRNVLNCLCICLFARGIYDHQTVVSALNSIGIETNEEELNTLGEEIFKLKQQMRSKLGYNLGQLEFPKRFYETPSLTGKINEETLNKMLEIYKSRSQESESGSQNG